jgi:hypothetical protein
MAEDILNLALGYPYPLPDASYVVEGGAVRPMAAEDSVHHRRGRTPVLAVGSNQSPEQITRKFPDAHWPAIPCELCTVHDFDSVYSAHVTGYGSIASCLHPSPGTEVRLFINWLHDDHMEHMHRTELGNENYAYASLDGIRIETEFGHTLDKIYFYCSNAGAFVPDGVPVPLAEIPAKNRQWEALPQVDIQTHVQVLTAPGLHFEAFVLSSAGDTAARDTRKAAMRALAQPFEHPGLTLLKS